LLFSRRAEKNFFCPNTHTRAGRGRRESKKLRKETIYIKKNETTTTTTNRETIIKSAPLHDFGSNGSKDKTSCGVHPTDKRIVGLSCPNLYPAVVIVFWEEAADFPLNPTMPPVATKPPTSKTFLVLNNALFCFFFLASMITSSLRRDCVSRSLSFLLNVFILLYQNKTRAGSDFSHKQTKATQRKCRLSVLCFLTRRREKKKKEIQTLNILNTKSCDVLIHLFSRARAFCLT